MHAYKEMKDIKMEENDGWTPLDYAMLHNREELVRACVSMSHESGKNEKSKEVKRMAEEWRLTESWVDVFIKVMTEECEETEIKTTMDTLKKTMLKLIKDKMPFSSDLYNLLYLDQKTEKTETDTDK